MLVLSRKNGQRFALVGASWSRLFVPAVGECSSELKLRNAKLSFAEN